MRRAAWRLLVDGDASGPWNMAVDEALFASAAGGAKPTLRFYGWDRAWLSLGYAQRRPSPRLLEACAAAGVGVVRRVTGGRAVLHGADLTYAVAAPEDALPRDLAASYGRVADALLAALATLGVVATRCDARPGPDSTSFDCFASAAPHEIGVRGRKLVGSAQRRGAGALLQHGSIRLRADPEAVRSAVGLAPGSSTSLAQEGGPAGREPVLEALVEGFRATLGLRLEQGGLTAEERSIARARARNRASEQRFAAIPIPRGTSRVPLGNR